MEVWNVAGPLLIAELLGFLVFRTQNNLQFHFGCYRAVLSNFSLMSLIDYLMLKQ